MAVMSLKGGNVVDAVVNAIVSGYRDDLILEELARAVEGEDITKEQFQSAIEGLKLYVARFADSIKSVSDAMKQFEFNDKQSIIKNRPMNLAQQVMQDVDGFKGATKEFYGEDDEEQKDDKEADIKKPNSPAPVVPEKKPEPKKEEPKEQPKKEPLKKVAPENIAQESAKAVK